MPKTFQTLRNSECLAHASSIQDWAIQKWCEADLLASKGFYGGALSARVVALEELTKALLLFIDSQGYNFRKLRYLKVLDTNHNHRHVFILVVALFDEFGKAMQDGRNFLESHPELEQKLKTDKAGFGSVMQQGILGYFNSTLGPRLVRVADWMSRLSTLRNDATYTGLNGSFRTPLTLTAEEYNEYATHLARSYNSLTDACRWLSQMEPDKQRMMHLLWNVVAHKIDYKKIDEFIKEHINNAEAFKRFTSVVNKLCSNAENIIAGPFDILEGYEDTETPQASGEPVPALNSSKEGVPSMP